LASRQGFGELKTEQLGGHSQEQQRHRQAPIDDDGQTAVIAEINDHNKRPKTFDEIGMQQQVLEVLTTISTVALVSTTHVVCQRSQKRTKS